MRKPELNVAQLKDLKTVYEHVAIDVNMLVALAVAKGLTLREAYERLVWDVAQVDADISRLETDQEVVK